MKEPMPTTIDEYIAGYPAEVQTRLTELRRTIRVAAPQAAEKISWGMATFDFHGNLVHFSAQKKHIGFHPTPSAIEAFADELADFTCSKGTVQLPYSRPLPLELVGRMVAFRVAEQERLVAERQSGKKAAPRDQRPRYEMPADVAQSLNREGLTEAYEARPPYQRNDYIGWIIRAKQPVTREKRLRQMLDELHAGDAYMGMEYKAKKTGEETT